MTELTDDEINDIWASVSPHDGEVDMIEYARAIEKALNEKKMPQETDCDWLEAQKWKGMDGAIAWHLIYRHAEGWGDTGAMMNAWLTANLPSPSTPDPLPQEPDEAIRLSEKEMR